MRHYYRFTRSLALLTSIIVLGACSSDSTNTPGSNNPPAVEPDLLFREELQTVVDEAVSSGMPGISLYVQDHGVSVSVVGGVVNRTSGEPVTPSSLFHAGSIGKTFVATMTLRLIDMGFLQLDDSIDLWLDTSMSAMIADSDKITIEMLLAHTSGIPDYFNQNQYIADFVEAQGRVWTPQENLNYINGIENNFEPGTDFRYSNSNYLLLGVIAERITGLPLGMALRQWVFEPASLYDTYGGQETLGQPEIAHGYSPISLFQIDDVDIDLPVVGTDVDTAAFLNAEANGDGPIESTPADLNSFVRTLIDTNILVSEELKTRMLSESLPGVSGHGFGIFIGNNGATFEHAGGTVGLLSLMSYTPSLDSSFATTVNGSYGDYSEIFDQYLTRLNEVLTRRR